MANLQNWKFKELVTVLVAVDTIIFCSDSVVSPRIGTWVTKYVAISITSAFNSTSLCVNICHFYWKYNNFFRNHSRQMLGSSSHIQRSLSNANATSFCCHLYPSF